MLRGVDTLTTDPVPALSPECRAIDLYVTYRYFPSEYQTTPGEATLIWYVDGVQQRTRHYTLDGKSITPGFHVEESVWKRDMPSQHTVEILFLCGTDVIRTTFVIPVNNYTDAEYDQLLSAQYPYKLEVVRNQCTVLVYGLDMSGVRAWIMNFDWEKLLQGLRDNSGEILSTATQAANSVFGVVANIGFGLIFAIYILLNKRKLGRQAKQLAYAFLKKPWADEVCDIASLSYRTFAGFLSGQCLEAVILGMMFFITLLVGGFPYAGSISVIIGCMSIIPFVGAFIGMAFGFLLIAVTRLEQALWFLVVFFVIQQIEGHIVYPKVVGSSVGLPALWTLLAVVVGGKVSGIFGIILFIPLFSVIYALVRRSVYSRLKKKNLKIS